MKINDRLIIRKFSIVMLQAFIWSPLIYHGVEGISIILPVMLFPWMQMVIIENQNVYATSY